MTENQIPEPTAELDFDEWLAGGERTTHYVTLYSRFDLMADIEELERQRVPYEAPAEGDESLGGETDPNVELDQQIEALYAQVNASKREFRVAALTDEESEQIRDDVRKGMSDEIDAAAAEGRNEAKKTARRLGITATNDINALVRVGGNEKATEFINREVALRKIAAAATTRHKGQWAPLTVDNVRAIYKKLGQAQLDLLANATMRASDEVPVVTVPKS